MRITATYTDEKAEGHFPGSFSNTLALVMKDMKVGETKTISKITMSEDRLPNGSPWNLRSVVYHVGAKMKGNKKFRTGVVNEKLTITRVQ